MQWIHKLMKQECCIMHDNSTVGADGLGKKSSKEDAQVNNLMPNVREKSRCGET